MSKPENFGNKDERRSFVTDASGNFEQNLGPRVFHCTYWLLPPLGCYPKHAPPPFILIRTDVAPNEYYAVQTGDGQFKVFARDGSELQTEQSRLRSISAHTEPGKSGTRDTVGVVRIEVRGE
jgi:hypothetical protein